MVSKKSLTMVLVLSAIIILTLGSCDPAKKYQKIEQEEIDKYLSNNPGLAFEMKPSGLYYYDVQVGSGTMPGKSDTVYLFYTGKFLDGTVFDSNVGSKDTLILPIGEGWLINGFDEGIQYMKTGGKSMLLIPSDLGYGAVGRGKIGGYTPILFDVELVKVKLTSGQAVPTALHKQQVYH
jgi:FKBP-type peptidyl-prolyl cis-trans isomerase FkpA